MTNAGNDAPSATHVHGAFGQWVDDGVSVHRGVTLPPAAAITVSDRCAAGVRDDLSGPVLVAALRRAGAASVVGVLVRDDVDEIQAAVRAQIDHGCRLIFTTGGTGLAPRDVTPEAVGALIERLVPGLADGIRASGAAHTAMGALSRGVAGVTGQTLIVTLPGSPGAVTDAMAYLSPLLPHIMSQLAGGDHDVTP